MRGLLVALLVAWASTTASAGDPTLSVVLVGNDPELRDALGDLLFADNTRVKAIGDRATPALAELGPESRRLADGHTAVATVWLSPTASGATLVTYDRQVDRFVVREVPYPLPLTATQAAETARMVRTMLRALRNSDDDGAITPAGPHPVRPLPRDTQLAASLGVGAWLGAPEATAAPLAMLAIAWRPHGLGAAITATLSPATDLMTESFRGDVNFGAIAVEVRRALRLAPAVRLTPGLGLALHVVSLGGELGASDKVASRRFDPALQVTTVVGITLPHRVELGFNVSADCLLRRQVYAAGTERILDVPRIQAMMAILIGVRL